MKILTVICLWLLLFTDAICADNSAVIAFARNNAEKFKNEITTTKGVALGSKITVQGVLDENDISSLVNKYDAESGEMVIDYSSFSMFMFLQSCKNKGGFIGKNAFGAKATVRRETCELFWVKEDSSLGINLEGARIKMSPSQFRTIKKAGVRTEVDLTLGLREDALHALLISAGVRPEEVDLTLRRPENDVVVSFSKAINAATIHDPVESHMKVWTVYGRFEEVRWFLPGEKQTTLVWKRQLSDQGRAGQ